jgi:hypothetical protein
VYAAYEEKALTEDKKLQDKQKSGTMEERIPKKSIPL